MNKRGTSIVAQIRKVEALNEKEQALGAQIIALQVSQRECAGTYQEQLGELVTKMAIAAGVHRLPLAVIDAAFKHIVDCGGDARIANEWIAKYSGGAIAKAVRDPDGGSRMSKAEGGMLVTVKLSLTPVTKTRAPCERLVCGGMAGGARGSARPMQRRKPASTNSSAIAYKPNRN